MSSRRRALFATSHDTPVELIVPIEAALGLDLEVLRLDLGRVTVGGGALERLDRLVQTVVTLGEGGERRLARELGAFAPDVLVAADAAAIHVLVRERERAARPAPVVAVVPELAPGAAWAVAADRWAALDDEAAVGLADLGVDGARVHVIGALARHPFAKAGTDPRASVRERFKLAQAGPVVLVVCAGLPAETIAQITLQLSLLARPPPVLFDVGDDAEIAAQLRRQVPPLGLRAKLFGPIADAPLLWRAADVVLGRSRPAVVLQALAVGAAFCAVEPTAADERAAARALVERGIGRIADKVLLLAAALEPLLGPGRAAAVAAAEARRFGEGGDQGSSDAAATLAALVADVAARRDEVLAESRAAAAEAERAAAQAAAAADASRARSARPPGELEDLGDDPGDLDAAPEGAAPSPGPPAAAARRLAEIARDEARLQAELGAARAEAERWAERKTLAEKKGEVSLAADAGREAERKRARMHAVLERLAALHGERQRLMAGGAPGATDAAPPRPAAPSPRRVDDDLARMKQAEAARGSSVDEELAALKRKMQTEGKKKP
jgi:UDP-N-acetylglucosamine:LPS N-acetylglucosamine transferase